MFIGTGAENVSNHGTVLTTWSFCFSNSTVGATYSCSLPDAAKVSTINECCNIG